MSVATLFNPSCDYNLYCNSITASAGFITPGSATISGNLVVLGNEAVNGALNIGQTTSGTGLFTVQGLTGGIVAIGNSGNNYYFNYDAAASTLSLLQSGTAINNNYLVNLGTGTMVLAGNMQLVSPSSGIYFGPVGVANYLNVYQTQQSTIAFSGPFTAAQNIVCKFTRVGNLITMTTGELLSAATTSSTITGTISPSLFFPDQVVTSIIQVYNSNSSAQGYITITSSGVMTISVAFGTAFAATGNCGFNQFSISYSL
jgi:hypothetical protein